MLRTSLFAIFLQWPHGLELLPFCLQKAQKRRDGHSRTWITLQSSLTFRNSTKMLLESLDSTEKCDGGAVRVGQAN